MQTKLGIKAAIIAAFMLSSFSYAQSVGGTIQGIPSSQSQYAGSGTQGVNQNAQMVLQLQALRAELASLRNQVEQQGFQLRQLQAKSSNGANQGGVNQSVSTQLNAQNVNPTNTNPVNNSANGEILPTGPIGSSNGSLVVPEGTLVPENNGTGSSVQFPLLPQDQALPQNQVGTATQPVQSAVAPVGGTVNQAGEISSGQSRPLSQQDQILKDGDKSIKTNLGEIDLYNKGIDKLSSQDYKSAASIFSAQLQNFPRGEKAGDGYFWLAETFYVQEDFDSAAKSYQSLVDLFPNHIRTPKALLKLIGVHQERKDKVSAKIALNALVAKYAGSTEASAAKSTYSSLL